MLVVGCIFPVLRQCFACVADHVGKPMLNQGGLGKRADLAKQLASRKDSKSYRLANAPKYESNECDLFCHTDKLFPLLVFEGRGNFTPLVLVYSLA